MASTDKHIWVLSELYYPESSATGYNVTKIAEGLAGRYAVRVLCAQPTYAARGTRAPVDEVRNGVRIHRCVATTLNKDILPLRLVNLVTISTSLFVNALKGVRPGDVVLVVTNPPTLPFVAWLACRLRRATMILRIEDIFPEALVAAGILGSRSLFVRWLNAAHRLLYRNADRVIVLGRDMMRIVRNKVGRETDRMVLITNFADSEEIRPMARSGNPLLIRLRLQDKFVVQYSGNMGRTHGLETLLACARTLHSESRVHFLFIGSGAKAAWLRKKSEELALDNVTILPPQPREDLAMSLNACDVAVISFVKGMAGVSVPCRMYNILSAGKPILAVADGESELAGVVEEEAVGWVVPPENPDALAGVILQAMQDPARIVEMAARARSAIETKYTLQKVVEAYRGLVASLEER